MTSAPQNDYVLIGHGYLGRRLAEEWNRQSRTYTVLTRSEEKASQLRLQGANAVVGEITQPETLQALPEAKAWIYCVGYDRQSGVDRYQAVVQGAANIAKLAANRSERFVITSSTSVYGVEDGAWIDEQTPCHPSTINGQQQQEAEQKVHELCAQGSTHLTILRLAGIYGPDRMLMRKEKILAGATFDGLAEAWLNLIHVEDAALVIQKVLDCPPLEAPVLMVSDNCPVRRRDFYGELAKRMGAPEPQFTGQPGPMTRTVGLNKRCRNQLMQELLQLRLTYPDYMTGLREMMGVSQQ